MMGLLKARLYVLGIEENIIKAKNDNEQDGVWYRIKVGDGVKDFACTCGKQWKVLVEPGKDVEFFAGQLKVFQQYDFSFDVDMTSGYAKIKLRTFKPVPSDKK